MNNINFITFHYSDQDQELISHLEKTLKDNCDRIFGFFDSSLEREPIEIRIIPTKKEYDEISKKRRGITEIPKWSIGNYHDHTIEYVSLNDYKNTSHAFPKERYKEELEYYKKTILHEFTHYVVDLYLKKNQGNSPLHYLNEGIAQYLSGQRDNIEIQFNYTLEDILNSNNCYSSWYLLTKYILEKYGKEYFLKLLRNQDLALEETPRLYEEAKTYYQS